MENISSFKKLFSMSTIFTAIQGSNVSYFPLLRCCCPCHFLEKIAAFYQGQSIKTDVILINVTIFFNVDGPLVSISCQCCQQICKEVDL